MLVHEDALVSDRAQAQAVAAKESQSDRILSRFAEFEGYVQQAQTYHAQGELAAAAAYTAIAAHVAASAHCGIFASPRLERLLTSIGRQIGNSDSQAATGRTKAPFRRVLHVCTQVAPVGGHTKMLCQWMRVDSKRRHSLVLTQHRGEIPANVSATVKAAGGRVDRLNHSVGGQLDWARQLRRIAKRHDVVVLHIHCEDVVPVIAFAETEKMPPVVFLNHADHLFWLGTSVAQVVVNLRDAATQLSQARRGIEERRNVLLPTLVEPTVRVRSRLEAKKALGLDADGIVMLSVARTPKYRTMSGVTFADMHVPVLRKHPEAVLVVVGVGDPDDWRRARDAVGGRIITLPEQPNPRPYFEAADIYVDSYPFVSSTSMMEAAGYGLPLVTLFTAPEAARIFAINHVALVGTALQATSDAEYNVTLSRLVGDGDFRTQAGQLAQEAVARMHTPPGWLDSLEAVYARAMDLPPLDNAAKPGDVEAPFLGEPDCRHQEIFGGTYPTVNFVKSYIGMLPPRQHFAHWQELRRAGVFRSPAEAATYLLPEWLKRVVKDRR